MWVTGSQHALACAIQLHKPHADHRVGPHALTPQPLKNGLPLHASCYQYIDHGTGAFWLTTRDPEV